MRLAGWRFIYAHLACVGVPPALSAYAAWEVEFVAVTTVYGPSSHAGIGDKIDFAQRMVQAQRRAGRPASNKQSRYFVCRKISCEEVLTIRTDDDRERRAVECNSTWLLLGFLQS